MNDVLDRMLALVQEDVGQRGLRSDPARNLISETAGDFQAACARLGGASSPRLGVVTGFYIPTADPPAAETDGPLGALFLARALAPLGIDVVILAEDYCCAALDAGLQSCGMVQRTRIDRLPLRLGAESRSALPPGITHLLAIERVGPSHTRPEVPAEHQNRCHTMRGRDITENMCDAHRLFEAAQSIGMPTIGIGDGGNEIGMGKIPWEVIDANIPRGGLVACRVPTDHLIVAGVSNWGAYALAAGIYLLRGIAPDPRLFDPEIEKRILEVMVEAGPLVDGVLAKPSVTVDGLTWEQYSAVLPRLGELCAPRRL